jgi:hypothetical protein
LPPKLINFHFNKIQFENEIFNFMLPSDSMEQPVVGKVTVTQLPKVGIRNLSPQLRNSAILRTTKSIAELRTKKSCGIAIADLQNLTSAIPQLSTVSCQFRYVLVPFPQLRMALKINQDYF